MLVELNSTDGEASEEENDFINRLADLYKIEPVELLQIKSGKFKPELSIPKMESDRIPFFQTCVMAMGVDLKVNDEEKKYCSELGMKMGLREEVIGVVMDLFEKHFPNPVPITELMNAYNIGRN